MFYKTGLLSRGLTIERGLTFQYLRYAHNIYTSYVHKPHTSSKPYTNPKGSNKPYSNLKQTILKPHIIHTQTSILLCVWFMSAVGSLKVVWVLLIFAFWHLALFWSRFLPFLLVKVFHKIQLHVFKIFCYKIKIC